MPMSSLRTCNYDNQSKFLSRNALATSPSRVEPDLFSTSQEPDRKSQTDGGMRRMAAFLTEGNLLFRNTL